MKQTAVEWLIEQWPILESQIPERILEQAKEMEKEQSKKMYEYAAWAMFYNGHGETFDEYWNKNFIR
jgi:hypothetical protein